MALALFSPSPDFVRVPSFRTMLKHCCNLVNLDYLLSKYKVERRGGGTVGQVKNKKHKQRAAGFGEGTQRSGNTHNSFSGTTQLEWQGQAWHRLAQQRRAAVRRGAQCQGTQ